MKTILLVDDEVALLHPVRIMLEMTGYAVRTAENMAEAVLILERFAIDVVISDYRMPNGDGLQLLNAIRDRFPKPLPFILTTGYGSPQNFIGRAAGIHRVVSKPFDFSELNQAVESALAT